MSAKRAPHLYAEAARWRGRRVGLYGGSFNPAHDGHRHVALAALKHLKLDAIWFMVSPGNPHKRDARDMASFRARLTSVEQLTRPHPRLHASAIEARLGTHRSADTLKKLKAGMPLTHFTWIMGADNLASFDRWYRWRDIVNGVPIAIFDRPGYSDGGLHSPLARCYRRFRIAPRALTAAHEPAWAFVRIPRHPASATSIRDQLGSVWANA